MNKKLIREMEKYSGIPTQFVDIDGLRYYVSPYLILRMEDKDMPEASDEINPEKIRYIIDTLHRLDVSSVQEFPAVPKNRKTYTERNSDTWFRENVMKTNISCYGICSLFIDIIKDFYPDSKMGYLKDGMFAVLDDGDKVGIVMGARI